MSLGSTAMSIRINWIWVFFFLSLTGYVVWAWTLYFRPSDNANPRSRATIVAGLCCATVSTALDVYLYVHAVLTGGYPLFHPIELFCIRVGGLAAILGLVIALRKWNKLSGHVAIISFLNLLMWFMDAMSQ